MIAEDDAGLLTTLGFILRDQGYEVSCAANGMEAQRMILDRRGNEDIDLLVTDLRMPEMNGLELIEWLRRDHENLPVIVITGHGDKDTVVRLLRLGCDEFLDKPFRPEDVRLKVSEVLRKRELQRNVDQGLRIRNQELARKVAGYELSFKGLRREVASAVTVCRELTTPDATDSGVGFAYRQKAMRDLGGDFLDICSTARGCDVLVADVAGHDMSASYHTVLIKAFFEENCRRGNDGEAFFRILNHSLLESGRNERMVTACFLRIDTRRLTAEIVSAGHPRVIKLRRDVPVPYPVYANGSVLGLMEDVVFDTKHFAVAPGDRVFLYTDGVTGAVRVDGPTGGRATLGEEGLEELLAATRRLSLERQVDVVWEEVMRHCRRRQADDMLFVGIEIPDKDGADTLRSGEVEASA